MQPSCRKTHKTSIDYVASMNDGKSPLNTIEVIAASFFRLGEEEDDGDDEEMIDLVEKAEEEEGDSKDGDSNGGDQVTETGLAQSEPGKQPVFHHEIYHRLVNLMSRQGAYSKFILSSYPRGRADPITAYEPPDYGIDSMDVTSFHPGQRDWSSTRAHRAPILTLWSEPPGSAPTYHIGCLLFNGRLILDYAGNPIRAFRHLPLTISSAVKGFRLETWIRQDVHRLHIGDILARLRTRNTPNGRQPLRRRGDLTDRANAFRLKSGLVTFRPGNWAARITARAYMDSLRTTAQRKSNRAIDRDLTPRELATLKKLSKRGQMNAATGSSASASVSARVAVSAPPTAVTPPSRPIRPRRLPPAVPPTQAPAQDLPDSREDRPRMCKESYTLRNALEETVDHFKKLTGQCPKPTGIAESYSSQWNALQAQFALIWKSQRPAEETPFLFKLGAWTGGIDRWDHWRTRVGGADRDREGEIFGEYMDATQEGTAYLGPDGYWRSIRDTWCNSHLSSTEGRSSRRTLTGRELSGEHSAERSEGRSKKDSEEDSEECSEENSDDEFDDGQ